MFVKINKRYINKINYFNIKKFKINIFSHLIRILKNPLRSLYFFLAPHFGECTQHGVDIMVRDRQIRKATKSSTE